MHFHWTKRIALAVAVASMPFAFGCASAATANPSSFALSGNASADGSVLCDGVIDRFLGLPGEVSGDTDSAASAPPLAGRWWIRSCSARRAGGELRLHLEGPGWYWVENHDNGLSVEQQIPFSLSLTLDNRVQAGSQGGVFSLWLKPVREPRVELALSETPQVRGNNAWGSMLGWVLPVRSMAAERISDSASQSLREQLRAGVTLTYDIHSGNADATVGKLAGGETPRHPFEGDSAWVVNDRVALAATSTQVVGPLEPGTSHVDVRVERGSGIAYRAVCARDMTTYYGAIARARLAEIPSHAFPASGSVVGPGDHEATLRVNGCRYYLVLSAWKDQATLASLRVRA